MNYQDALNKIGVERDEVSSLYDQIEQHLQKISDIKTNALTALQSERNNLKLRLKTLKEYEKQIKRE